MAEVVDNGLTGKANEKLSIEADTTETIYTSAFV